MLVMETLAFAAAAAPLVGTWRIDISAVSTATTLGFETETRLHTVGLIRGDGATTRYRVCDLRPDGGLVRTEIPQAWIDSLAEREIQALVDDERVWIDLGATASGFDPAMWRLSEVTAGRSVDQDGDGAPGVTLRVAVPLFGTGEIFLADVSAMRLNGLWTDPDHVEGRVAAHTAHVVLGADPGFLAREAEIRFLPEASGFTLTAVDTDFVCADLK